MSHPAESSSPPPAPLLPTPIEPGPGPIHGLSWTGRRWTDPTPLASGSGPDVDALARDLRLPPLVAACLARRAPRGHAGTPWGTSWLRPDLSDLHDPWLMSGMDVAVERLERAIAGGERIRIVTDYDVDGTTSSLILQEALRLAAANGKVGATAGARIDYHIPHRFHEGYGFSVEAAKRAVEDGIDLIVTADIGVRDHQAVTAARAGGTDVIVLDHHLPSGASVPPDATAVLCPPQAACAYPNRHLAACGISVKLAQAILRTHPLRDRILRSMLKLAAIGTVADVVDLASHENRAIVSLGLEALNADRHGPGLQALLEVADLHPTSTGGSGIDAGDLGFRLGPRINAAGRIDDARKVVDLFTRKDLETARTIARELDHMNHERRGIQDRLVERILAEGGAVGAAAQETSFLVAAGPESEGWHRGVVGIVAARVREQIHRPVAIVAISGDEARGSVRSIPSVHAVEALDACKDLLVRYGGHPMAAGFTVKTNLLPALRERLDEWVRSRLSAEDLVPVLELDGACTEEQIARPLAEAFAQLAPFGKGNPEPIVKVAVRPREVEVFSGRHLRFRFGGAEAVWWQGAPYRERVAGGASGPSFEIAGTPGLHRFRGRQSVRLTVSDGRMLP